MLTSEFAPVRGGIGTYAREIAAAASDLGADVTVAAPDYGNDNADEDRLLPFEVRRFAGGLHSMRDLPAKIRLARRFIGSSHHDVVHAADWPFFIPLALSRHLTTARTLMSVHGTEINETQTALKRLAIRCTGVFGPRSEVAANSHYTADLFRDRFAVDDRGPRLLHDEFLALRRGAAAPPAGRHRRGREAEGRREELSKALRSHDPAGLSRFVHTARRPLFPPAFVLI